VTQERPVRGRFMVHMQEGSVLYVCIKFEADSSIRSKVIKGVQQFRNWVTWSGPRTLRCHFQDRTQEGSVLHLCSKFEADRSFYSKL